MDLVQLIRISAILGLIAGLNAIVYFIALSVNTHYKRKLALHRVIPKMLKKEPRGDTGKVPPAPAAKEVPDAIPFAEKIEGRDMPQASPGKGAAAAHGKFAVGDRVEFFGSRGEMAGKIISFNNSNSKLEYRYLVDWEKNGIWWVSEDQIEHSEHKGIEVNA